MTNKQSQERRRKEFLEKFCMALAEDRTRHGWATDNPQAVLDFIESQIQQAEENIAQKCYNQCLAVECGEGECAEAIATKFPEHISRFNDPLKSKLT